MAGKTLPGIGDDEESDGQSGEKDSSGVSLASANTEEPTPSRATNRMHQYSGPTIIDEDKVAEGLKRLRSLDEPLGPIPNSMPTLKEGMPAVGGAAPPATTATPAASAQGLAEILRARGTAHGHAITGLNAPGQIIVPAVGDDRMKGTLLGHMLHLPDLPTATEERPAEVRAIELRPAERIPGSTGGAGGSGGVSVALTPIIQDFTHGESRFFDTEPERELELERPRSKLMGRSAIAFAVLSIGAVATIAWMRASKPDAADTAGPEAAPTTLPSAAAAQDNPSAAQMPTGATEVVPTAAAATEAVPTPAAAEAAPTPPAAIAPTPMEAPAAPSAAPTPAPEPRAEAPRPSETPAPRVHTRSAHTTSPSPSTTPSSPRAASVPKPPVPGKHVPSDKDDPDGTLPLSD